MTVAREKRNSAKKSGLAGIIATVALAAVNKYCDESLAEVLSLSIPLLSVGLVELAIWLIVFFDIPSSEQLERRRQIKKIKSWLSSVEDKEAAEVKKYSDHLAKLEAIECGIKARR